MKRRMKKKDKFVTEESDALENAAPPEEMESEVDAQGADEDGDLHADIPEAAISEADEAGGETAGLEAAVAALEQERNEYKDQLLRTRAEFDNYRKRMARDSEMIRKTAAQGLMRALLPIVDNLERALSHVEDRSDGFAQGVEMILKQFSDVLTAQGLEVIPAKGEPFDPNVHEALTHQPSTEYPADVVVEEFLRGYRLGDYVLRPSQVVVSSGAPAPEAPDAGEAAPDDPS